MCVIHCAVIPFTLDVRLVGVPVGVTQEEGQTGLLHLPSAVLAFIFIARKIHPSISLVDREIEFCVPRTNELIVLHYLLGILFFYFFHYLFFFVRKIPVRLTVPRFELMS